MHHTRGKHRLFGCLLILLVLLAACDGEHPSASGGQTQPCPSFVLASKGLAADGMWKCTPAFADINGDGFLDVAAISRLGDGAKIWLGDGEGAWTDASTGLGVATSCGGGVDFGDINNDGHLDLAVADHCNGVFVYLGNGKGLWQASTVELYPDTNSSSSLEDEELEEEFYIGAEDLAVGDVNEDGFLDLVVGASDEGGLTVYLGDGSGKNWKMATGDGLPSVDDPQAGGEKAYGIGWVNQVLLHDMNLDKHLDVVASYYSGPSVWLGDGTGRWEPRSDGLPRPMIEGLYRGIAVGDINEDGLPDIAAANWIDGPEVYLQNPDGSWQQTPGALPPVEGGAVGLAMGDFDQDGHLDLIAGCSGSGENVASYGLFVCKGDGRGGWTESMKTGVPSTGLSIIWGIALDDVNGDNLLDLAVSTGGSGDASPEQSDAGEDVPEPSLPRMQVWLNKPCN